jgi:hypothetical protein
VQRRVNQNNDRLGVTYFHGIAMIGGNQADQARTTTICPRDRTTFAFDKLNPVANASEEELPTRGGALRLRASDKT